MTTKIVINACYGGFGIAKDIEEIFFSEMSYEEKSGRSFRLNPVLIALIERVGSKAVSGPHAELQIVEVPFLLKHWEIRDYDGYESIIASESPIIHINAKH